MLFRLSLFGLLGSLLLLACSPKAEPAVVTTPDNTTTTEPDRDVDPRCKTFDDSRDPDHAADNYVIYRSFIKSKDYEGALPKWRYVYENSPAADGNRNTVFTDGIFLYNWMISQDSTKKDLFADTIAMLYAHAEECYPDNAYMIGLRGFDSYYTYPGLATDQEVYALFKRSMELEEEDFPFFIINPMSKLVYDRYDAGDIDLDEARWVVERLIDRTNRGVADCEENGDCATWSLIEGYMPSAIQQFENVEGFFDCDYYVELYYPRFQESKDDCANIVDVLNRLKWGGCTRESSQQYAEALDAYEANCQSSPEPGSGNSCTAGYEAIRNNQNQEAIDQLGQCVELINDPGQKAQVLMAIATTQFRMRRFSAARATARQAAQLRPNWGRPYMLIGRMYASSGPLCGPGTGFDSQVVVWPAIDMWNRAKRVDPSVSGEANQLINRYTQYMPFRQDVFQRGLTEGATYTVGCWIQEQTTIRTVK